MTEQIQTQKPNAGSGPAMLFFKELMENFETLAGIAEQHGARTLADLMYLQNAILDGSFIELYPDESAVRKIVDELPSAALWRQFIQMTENEGEDEYGAIVRRCAEQGRALMQLLSNKGTLQPLYLYARESVPGRAGELFLVRDTAPNPNGYKLVTGEGLRVNVPYDSYYQWIYERARSARILSLELAA